MTRLRRAPGAGSADDSAGWLVQERRRYDAYGNQILSLGPLARLDGAGKPISAEGNIVSFDIDAQFRSRVLRENIVIDADRTLVHHFHYDHQFGSVTGHTGPDGSETRFGYDNLGRLTSIHRPLDPPSRPSTQFVYGVGESTSDGGAISWIDNTVAECAGCPKRGSGLSSFTSLSRWRRA